MSAGFRVKVGKRDHYPLFRNTPNGENQVKIWQHIIQVGVNSNQMSKGAPSICVIFVHYQEI